MRTAFIETLLELAREDPRIVLITGDLGFGVLTPFMTELPHQFVNAGVAEQNMTGMAAGMALSGTGWFQRSICRPAGSAATSRPLPFHRCRPQAL